jgi:hypothetical protein
VSNGETAIRPSACLKTDNRADRRCPTVFASLA